MSTVGDVKPQAHEVVAHGWSYGRLPLPPGGLWDEFAKFWEDLPADSYIKASHGTVRHRRIGRLLARGGQGDGLAVDLLPHTAFFQSTEVNRVYGGQVRTFAPLTPETYESPYFRSTLGRDLALIRQLGEPERDWLITVHLIRVAAGADTASAPAPEGRHSDGHEYVVMHLIGRGNCAGGMSRIFRVGADEPVVERTLKLPMETLVLDDQRMEHEVTPIRPDGATSTVRDMMIIDFERPDPRSANAVALGSIDLTADR